MLVLNGVDGSKRENCRWRCWGVDVVVDENRRFVMWVEILLFACLVNLVNKGDVPDSFLFLFLRVDCSKCLIVLHLSFT